MQEKYKITSGIPNKKDSWEDKCYYWEHQIHFGKSYYFIFKIMEHSPKDKILVRELQHENDIDLAIKTEQLYSILINHTNFFHEFSKDRGKEFNIFTDKPNFRDDFKLVCENYLQHNDITDYQKFCIAVCSGEIKIFDKPIEVKPEICYRTIIINCVLIITLLYCIYVILFV